jgi:hypothetical protein
MNTSTCCMPVVTPTRRLPWSLWLAQVRSLLRRPQGHSPRRPELVELAEQLPAHMLRDIGMHDAVAERQVLLRDRYSQFGLF